MDDVTHVHGVLNLIYGVHARHAHESGDPYCHVCGGLKLLSASHVHGHALCKYGDGDACGQWWNHNVSIRGGGRHE